MKPINKIINNKQKGVTSILVVIAVSVILTIIIGGIAALTVREVRQASNTELSNRALQTAEAGVKAMVQKLNSNPTYKKTDCAAGEFANVVSDSSQVITCITATSQFTGSYESYLEKDRATQIFLGEAYSSTASSTSNTPQYLKVSWNEKTLDIKNFNEVPYPSLGDLYPDSDGYKYAAAMEITIISWPSAGLSATNAEVATIFVMPGRGDEGYTKATGRTQVTTTCSEQEAYNCSTVNTATKPGFDIFAALGKSYNSTTKFAVRVKPRYANTHYKIEAYNSAGAAVNIQSSKAQIDVTAKVGTLYRRVKADKTVLPSSVENVFDSVLFSGDNVVSATADKDICKNIITKRNAANTAYEEVLNSTFKTSCK